MAVFGKKEETKDVPELPKPPSFSPSAPSSIGADTSASPLPDSLNLNSGPSPMPASIDSSPAFPPPPLPTAPSFSPPTHSASSPPSHSASSGSQELLTEDIEKIAESIIDEKWEKIKGELDDLKTWKVDLDTQVKGFKSQLDTLGKRVDDAQNAMLGKVEEYNKSLGGVNVEIMAMGKVFEKIIPQFTENVNKLSELVDRKASKTKK
jgi:hypothetical protein